MTICCWEEFNSLYKTRVILLYIYSGIMQGLIRIIKGFFSIFVVVLCLFVVVVNTEKFFYILSKKLTHTHTIKTPHTN